ncbi:MAG: ribosomal protein S18-alanine N-acetyltransferase [Christensenellaceae bacterium]|jgi:ribosomal-protein-alanine N-acetyltransferase
MQIRRADFLDLPEILALEESSFPVPWSIEILYHDICLAGYDYYLIKEAGVAVGYAGMDIIVDEAHIRKICVREDMRKKGYGSILLQRLMKEAYQKGAIGMTLEVRVSNAPAIAFYEKYGFQIEGIRKKYYADKEDANIMWNRNLAEMTYDD